ncbi:MAG: FAD-binding oxidoreductase, partial [Pseudomonas sp.]|nr:FAD-binding oxidoreductase [Pseudomonas sp.]
MAHPTACEHPPLAESLRDELCQLLGSRFSTSASVREHHGSDISALDPMPPDAVAYANSLEDIVSISSACYRHDTPMIAYGSGT